MGKAKLQIEKSHLAEHKRIDVPFVFKKYKTNSAVVVSFENYTYSMKGYFFLFFFISLSLLYLFLCRLYAILQDSLPKVSNRNETLCMYMIFVNFL